MSEIQPIPTPQVLEKLRAVQGTETLTKCSQRFAVLVAGRLSSRETQPATIDPIRFVAICRRAVSDLQRGMARRESVELQKAWPIQGRKVQEQIPQIVELALGKEFAAEVSQLWTPIGPR